MAVKAVETKAGKVYRVGELAQWDGRVEMLAETVVAAAEMVLKVCHTCSLLWEEDRHFRLEVSQLVRHLLCSTTLQSSETE